MAEAFPDLYRTILDGIADLERAGQRTEAYRIRIAAASAYSGAWSDAGHRRLALIAERLEQSLAAADGSGPGSRHGAPDGAPDEGPLAALLRLAAPR